MIAISWNPRIATELQFDVPSVIVTALIAMSIHAFEIEIAN